MGEPKRPQKPWRAESNKIFTTRAIFFAPVQEGAAGGLTDRRQRQRGQAGRP